jgi:hypothetical protein
MVNIVMTLNLPLWDNLVSVRTEQGTLDLELRDLRRRESQLCKTNPFSRVIVECSPYFGPPDLGLS